MTRQAWDADRDGLPFSIRTELLAEADGLLMGRFLMAPLPGAHPTLEQRLVAVALADQAGRRSATRGGSGEAGVTTRPCVSTGHA
ncbi:MAG TPA: hypothetical protein VFE59_22770 [Trebonia sp.]|nr:hypothetical protein [Trebonia sp.]